MANASVSPPRPRARPGTVAVSADLAGRYTQFAMCLQRLTLPAGTRVDWKVGSDVAGNRNRACAEMEGDWLWFIDDDHAFHEGTLLRLLAHNVDIVAPLVLRRQQPFATVACLDDRIMDLRGMPGEGLVEVELTGSAGMLIRRRVLDALEAPWFGLRDGVSEDVSFCQVARAAGFRIHVDLGTRMGHITTAGVWPVWDEARGWVTGFTIADGLQLTAEIATVPE